MVAALLAAAAGALLVDASAQAPAPPPWAFTVNAPSPAGVSSPTSSDAPKTVPGSTMSFTAAEIRDAFNPPDWHPQGHPPMPVAVRRGRKPEMRACGFCHLPNGQGRPENASLAGLPAGYIVQQMADFKSGARRSSEPRMGPPNAMVADAVAATDEEIRQAAEYFASFPYQKWVRVVESAMVPKMRVAGWMHVPLVGPDAADEPIGQRIIETPENRERTELRDDSSGFVAYVPPGSVARGRTIVQTGASGLSVACGTCHGADLKGLGPVPPLAGRSPSYTVRQLFDLQQGARRGSWSALMKAAVEKLTVDDMIAIAAYTASFEP